MQGRLKLTLCNWPKTHCLILAGTFIACLSGCQEVAPASMRIVTGFKADRYLGEGHQVAAIPAWFQSHCVAHMTAKYAPGKDDRISVLNSCETSDGSLSHAVGEARFVAASSEGRLEVTFLKLWGSWLWQAAGDYWIIGLDPAYQWAVLGYPAQEFAWVLGRSTTLEMETLLKIRRSLEREGYDACELHMTTPDQKGRLCDAIG